MFLTLLSIHSVLRWAIVIVSLIAVLYALYGFFAKPAWRPIGDQIGSLFTWTVRINLLLGFVLWVMRFGNGGFNVFFHIIHPLFMFIALALAEVMAARRNRQQEDALRWRFFLLGTIIPTALILLGIPWPR